MPSAPDGRVLADAEVGELLGAYGIECWPATVVRSAAEAVAAADRFGYPVAVKGLAEQIRHRPDLGGVRLGLADPAAVAAAWHALPVNTGPDGREPSPAVVQPMAPPGVATVVGIVDDPSFGALVSFGVGGVATDLLGDRAYAALPLSDVDAAALVRAPRAAPLLSGYRGAAPVDTTVLADLLLRVARLAEDRPELLELELNPVLVGPTGLAVLAGTARVGPPTSNPDPGPRRLV